MSGLLGGQHLLDVEAREYVRVVAVTRAKRGRPTPVIVCEPLDADGDEADLRAARIDVDRDDGRRYLTIEELQRRREERELTDLIRPWPQVYEEMQE